MKLCHLNGIGAPTKRKHPAVYIAMQPSTAQEFANRLLLYSRTKRKEERNLCASICSKQVQNECMASTIHSRTKGKAMHAALPIHPTPLLALQTSPAHVLPKKRAAPTTREKNPKEETRASLFHVIMLILASYVVELLAKGQLQLHTLIG